VAWHFGIQLAQLWWQRALQQLIYDPLCAVAARGQTGGQKSIPIIRKQILDLLDVRLQRCVCLTG
jgi:hypothetical protein